MLRALVITVALVCAAISLSPTQAAKGGCTATLAADANPSVAGQTVNFSGSCYSPQRGTEYWVVVEDGNWNSITSFQVFPVGGAISFQYTFNDAGTYFVQTISVRNDKVAHGLVRLTQTVN